MGCGRRHLARLLPVLLLAAAAGVAPAAAARAAPAQAAIPLLLLHDTNEDCGTAWRATPAAAYLAAAGFETLDLVGYPGGADAVPGVCSENLQRPPPLPGLGRFPGVDRCAALSDQLDRLSCLLAWYVYERYTQFGKPVDVLARGTGGQLAGDAIGAADAGARDFPPHALWVANAVAVAAPSGVPQPQGYGGTHWSLDGSGAALPAIAAQLDATAPPPLPSQELTLRSPANDKYVSAELGFGTGNPRYGLLRARAILQGPWERWTAVQLPSGHVAIRSDDSGEYVAAELGRAGDDYNELRARTDFSDLGPWEVWDLVPSPDGTFSLQLADLDRDYYYVTAELSMSGPMYGLLRARSSSVGTWEELTSGGPPPAPVLLGTPDFDGYCRMSGRGGATVAAGNPNGWACSAPGAALDPQTVCGWTYWTPAVGSRLGRPNDPYSWQCRG